MVTGAVDTIVWTVTSIAVVVVVVVGGAVILGRIGRPERDRGRLTQIEKRVAELERDRDPA